MRAGEQRSVQFCSEFSSKRSIDLKRVAKNKKVKRYGGKFMFTCLSVFFRFLQVTCVGVLWLLTSSRKLEISVELRKEGV